MDKLSLFMRDLFLSIQDIGVAFFYQLYPYPSSFLPNILMKLDFIIFKYSIVFH